MKPSGSEHTSIYFRQRHTFHQQEAFVFIFIGHPCRCFRFRCGLFWGQVGALSLLPHLNAVSKQSSWCDSLLLSCCAGQCHQGVQVPWGWDCLIHKVVWADGLCQLLSHVHAKFQGSRQNIALDQDGSDSIYFFCQWCQYCLDEPILRELHPCR